MSQDMTCPHCNGDEFNVKVTDMWETRAICVECSWNVKADTMETVVKNQSA